MTKNPYFEDIAKSNLFLVMRQEKERFLKEHPEKKLISLSIGDTTEPLVDPVVTAMNHCTHSLGTPQGYVGYGPEEGILSLRQKIASQVYHDQFSADEIFISDGIGSDIGRLQLLFSPHTKTAVQDPAYPAYRDTSILMRGKENVLSLPCTAENNFFPDLSLLEKNNVELLFLCSPNNPTGKTFSYEELARIVAFAYEHKIIIIFDAAYSAFVNPSHVLVHGADETENGSGFENLTERKQSFLSAQICQSRDPFLSSDKAPREHIPSHPSSIYQVPHAKEVAIEMGSLSKSAGFTGVRLGWTVVPAALSYKEGSPVHPNWMRIVTTFFNGASIISQKGALEALSVYGLEATQTQTKNYLENGTLLAHTLRNKGYTVYGETHSPYLWVDCKGKNSWDAFSEFLNRYAIITTPGVGFGTHGEGFLRISSFANRAHILEAIHRLST